MSEPQPFEAFPELALQVERMACTGVTGSLFEWQAFTDALNAVCAIAAALPHPQDTPNDR